MMVDFTVSLIDYKQQNKSRSRGEEVGNMMTSSNGNIFRDTGGCFTNISRALQNILSKFVYRRNRTSYENFKLKLCMCAQSHALGTHTKFRLEILSLNVISSIVDFREKRETLVKQPPGPLCGEFTGDRWPPPPPPPPPPPHHPKG